MTQQEIFDTVLEHLRKQGKASLSTEGDCTYRGPDGTSCAVGCLIPDELYDPLIENVSLPQIFNNYPPFRREGDWPELRPIMARISDHLGVENEPLLDALQRAHDGQLAAHGLSAWEYRMRIIALDFRLEYKPASI